MGSKHTIECRSNILDQKGNHVGRKEELEFLLQRWWRCSKGRGSCMVVLGEAGVGKTRLLDELEHLVKISGPFRLVRVDFARERDRPLAPFIRSLDIKWQNLTAPTELENPISSKRGEGPEGEELDVFEGIFQAVCGPQKEIPVLLRIEDVHWADSSSKRLLQYLARRSKDYGILIVATARGEELQWEGDPASTVNDVLESIVRCEGMEVLHLHALDRYQTNSLLSKTLRGPLDFQVSDRIFEISEGNPLFALWHLEVLLDSGQLVELDGVFQVKGHIINIVPTGVSELLMERLDGLTEDEIVVLEQATVIGTTFGANWLNAFSPPWDPSPLLERICLHTGILIKEGDVYHFVHELFRTAIYENVPPIRATAMHASLASWLIENQPEVPLGYLADELELGGMYDKAREYGLMAGREYLDRFAAKEAIYFFQRIADDRTTRDEIWVNAMEGLGDAMFEIGDYSEASEVFSELIPYRELDRDRLLIKMADCWSPSRLGQGRTDRFLEILGNVKNIPSLPLEDQGEYWAFHSLISAWNNDYSKSRDLSRKALSCYKGANRWDKVAYELTNLGLSYAAYSDPMLALPMYMDVLEIYREHPRIKGEETLYLALGETYLSIGMIEDAQHCFQESLERAKLTNEQADVVWAHYHLGTIGLFEQDFEKALAHATICRDLAYRSGFRLLSCMPLWVMVVVYILMDNIAEAERTNRELLRRYDTYSKDFSTALDGFVVCTEAWIGIVKSWDPDPGRIEKGIGNFCRGQYMALNELLVRWTLAGWLSQKGFVEQSLEQWEKALKLCEYMCNIQMMERIIDIVAGLKKEKW
jgi:tetratricopeptide (TPR) repeat protein